MMPNVQPTLELIQQMLNAINRRELRRSRSFNDLPPPVNPEVLVVTPGGRSYPEREYHSAGQPRNGSQHHSSNPDLTQVYRIAQMITPPGLSSAEWAMIKEQRKRQLPPQSRRERMGRDRREGSSLPQAYAGDLPRQSDSGHENRSHRSGSRDRSRSHRSSSRNEDRTLRSQSTASNRSNRSRSRHEDPQLRPVQRGDRSPLASGTGSEREYRNIPYHSGPKIEIPKPIFRDTASNHVGDASHFLKQVKTYQKVHGLTDIQTLNLMEIFLEGGAKKWYEMKGQDFFNMKQFEEAFLEIYFHPDMRASLIKEVHNYDQPANKGIKEWALDLRSMYLRAKPDGSESELIEIVLRNMEPDLRNTIKGRRFEDLH